jgi:ribosomal-protein-alanine N-acetyltransferase
MIKLWMAPGGLHIEPGETRDAVDLARIHAQGFYRGWPVAEFASFLSRRRHAGLCRLRRAAPHCRLRR